MSAVIASFIISLTTIIISSVVLPRLRPSHVWEIKEHSCNHSTSCGIITNIRSPFRLASDPGGNCGTIRAVLKCEDNTTFWYSDSGDKYRVEEIHYSDYSFDSWFRVVDVGLIADDYSSMPLYSSFNFKKNSNLRPIYDAVTVVVFLSCEEELPVNSSIYLKTAEDQVKGRGYSYVLVRYYFSADDVADTCTVEKVIPIDQWNLSFEDARNYSYKDVHDAMAYGFTLQFEYTERDNIWTKIYYHLYQITLALVVVVGKPLCLFPFISLLLILKCKRMLSRNDDYIETFLQNHNDSMPLRYSYSDIIRITNGFNKKLGEGGFGTVFKGKLRSGRIVAVKLLNMPKSNGQDFINEVATIGTIHHFNIVRLVGYCAERSKRALVYDYMPNGSLEKYIFLKQEDVSLSCEKMYEISLGVARGIEYLHRGCDMQILHFDIKPHNILLDENFTPKLSDFGLAKLYPTDNSIVSLTAARGTMGYMAPELFYKNIGGVSHKADVYSFGMLLMEMAGRRQNVDPYAENISEIYFPLLAYDQLNKGKEIEIEEASSEGEREMVKKMIVVALWCIQMKPSDRPSMSKVVKMLEGSFELLEMPPKPTLNPILNDMANANPEILSRHHEETNEGIVVVGSSST